MDWQKTIALIGIISNFVVIVGIIIMRVQYIDLRNNRDRWQHECKFAQSNVHELCRQVEELQVRLGKEKTDYDALLGRHSKKCDELRLTQVRLEDSICRVAHLESQNANLPKNYLSLIQAMQACTRFISSNQWLLEQSKELTSAVAALADVADRIESEDSLCPR